MTLLKKSGIGVQHRSLVKKCNFENTKIYRSISILGNSLLKKTSHRSLTHWLHQLQLHITIHMEEVQSLCLCWGHQHLRKSVCSKYLFLTSPFPQMGHYSRSGCLFSSPLSFSLPTAEPGFSRSCRSFFSRSILYLLAITLICTIISYPHYSLTGSVKHLPVM